MTTHPAPPQLRPFLRPDSPSHVRLCRFRFSPVPTPQPSPRLVNPLLLPPTRSDNPTPSLPNSFRPLPDNPFQVKPFSPRSSPVPTPQPTPLRRSSLQNPPLPPLSDRPPHRLVNLAHPFPLPTTHAYPRALRASPLPYPGLSRLPMPFLPSSSRVSPPRPAPTLLSPPPLSTPIPAAAHPSPDYPEGVN